MLLRNLREYPAKWTAGICSAEGDGDVDAGAGGGAGGGGGGDNGGGAGDPWHAGLDAETIGVLQTKGWDKLTPAQAAAQAVASYREAERFLGVPRDQLLRKPDPNDQAAVNAFYQQLGKPADKSGYEFTDVKFTDGTELDTGFTDFVRDMADRLHLSKDAATQVAQGFVKFMETADAADVGERTAAVQAGKAELQKNWGTNFDAHKFIANQGALKVGVSQAEFDAMFETPGGAKMLEVFRKVGELAGEGRFVQNGNGGNGQNLTQQQAVARKNELMNDSAWVKRYTDGGAAEIREMTALNTIIVADATENDF